MTRTGLALAALLVAGCGGQEGGSSTHDFTGTASIQGGPHGGAYSQCVVSAAVAGVVAVSCAGLPTCPDCAIEFDVPSGGGSGTCGAGTANVVLGDPSIGNTANAASAGCTEGTSLLGPNPSCPNDQSTGCNEVLGDCTMSSSVASSETGLDNPWGHFSGALTATVWSGSKYAMCNANGDLEVATDGTSYAISFNAGW